MGTHLKLKAVEVLPPLQVILHSLNEPCEVIGETREKLLDLELKHNILLTNESEEENHPRLKEDNIASSYLPKTDEFKNVVTSMYSPILLSVHIFCSKL